jgi:DnaJ-class molecular chaperone
MEEDKEYYKVLGVERTADDDTIRSAYKKLAFKYHPDKNPGDPIAEEKFKEVGEAFEVLKDPIKRETYDKYGMEGLNRQGFQPTDFDPSELLKNMFGFENTISVPPVEVILEVTLEEIFTGCTKDFTFERYSLCVQCNGKGAKGKHVDCKQCQGKGIRMMRIMQGFAQIPCDECEGTGINPKAEKCKDCDRSGSSCKSHTIKITIEKGHSRSKPIIIENEGNEIPHNERDRSQRNRSNVVIIIKEKSHPVFTRGSIIKELRKVNENNLVTELELSLQESLCGFQKNIQHLDGKSVKVCMADMVKHSDILVIKDEGMYEQGSNKRGDMLIRIRVETKKLNKNDKQKLWAILTDEPYLHHAKNSPSIVLYDEYKKNVVEENEKEELKEQYKQRRGRKGNPGEGNVECATQ